MKILDYIKNDTEIKHIQYIKKGEEIQYNLKKGVNTDCFCDSIAQKNCFIILELEMHIIEWGEDYYEDYIIIDVIEEEE